MRKTLRVLLPAMLRHAPAALFGRGWQRMARTARLTWMLAACWLHYFNETRLRSLYQELWQSMICLARLDVPDLPSATLPIALHESRRWPIDAWAADRLFGF